MSMVSFGGREFEGQLLALIYGQELPSLSCKLDQFICFLERRDKWLLDDDWSEDQIKNVGSCRAN